VIRFSCVLAWLALAAIGWNAAIAVEPPPGATAGLSSSAENRVGQANRATRPAAKQALRDPTRPGPQLRELISPSRSQAKAAEVPAIQLRGRIVDGPLPNAAMLDIDQQPYLLRKGSEITLTGANAGAQTLRVLDVTAEAVRVEILPLGRTLILN
jgi:hypothetical protein